MVTQRGGAAYPQIRPQLQPETGVEPGELREIDGGSGLKARRQRRPSKKVVNAGVFTWPRDWLGGVFMARHILFLTGLDHSIL
jgi:hypothetical protein